MATDPKVSVCMIAYNHERYIAQAVESALMQQTDFPFEIVIGEDCSTDHTRRILLELQRQHPDIIRLLPRERNLGMNRNFADVLANCEGKYVALLEGDDYWTNESKLQIQADALDAHDEWAISFHSTRFFYEDNLRPAFNYPPEPMKDVSHIDDLISWNFMQTCSVVFRNKLFEKLPDWHAELKLGDWPLHILNAEHGDIGYLPDVMADYRIHGQSNWSAKSREYRVNATITMYACLLSHFGERFRSTITSRIIELATDPDKIRSSLTWRITAPMRALADRLRIRGLTKRDG